jgi:hypothetical protein
VTYWPSLVEERDGGMCQPTYLTKKDNPTHWLSSNASRFSYIALLLPGSCKPYASHTHLPSTKKMLSTHFPSATTLNLPHKPTQTLPINKHTIFHTLAPKTNHMKSTAASSGIKLNTNFERSWIPYLRSIDDLPPGSLRDPASLLQATPGAVTQPWR